MTLIVATKEQLEDGANVYWTMKAMKAYGGGFVKALADAMAQADHINLEKIRKAWPEYMAQYEAMGRKLREAKERKHEDGT
jgi:hypothetical protein